MKRKLLIAIVCLSVICSGCSSYWLRGELNGCKKCGTEFYTIKSKYHCPKCGQYYNYPEYHKEN